MGVALLSDLRSTGNKAFKGYVCLQLVMHAIALTAAVAVSRVLAITMQLVGYWSSNNARIDLVLRPCHAGARDSSHDDKAVNVAGSKRYGKQRVSIT